MTHFSFMSRTNWAWLALLWLVAAAGLWLVPLDRPLPVHWNINGEIDAQAPAWLALVTGPLIATLMIAFMAFVRRARLQKDFEAGRHLVAMAISASLVILIGFEIIMIAEGQGRTVDVPRMAAFMMGLLLMLIGNVLPKSQPNWVAGLRLPWTLRDRDNWRITHLWAGRTAVVAGILLVVLAFFSEGAALLSAVLVLAMAPMLVGVAVSYAMAVKGKG